jgi:hypothetical protein
MYYSKSGSFANALIVDAFETRAARDEYVNSEPMSGEGSHYTHNRTAITRRHAERILGMNNQMRRNHQHNSAYDECFGTTGTLDEIRAGKM